MNIQAFIEKLGFTSNLFIYMKEYKLHNYTITIDLKKEKIFYRTTDEKTTVERQEDGQIQLGDHTTSNFSSSESLVLLECVNRLLEKGYAPNDLHLERKWKVGHGASGGKADINVYGKDGKTLLIIECKTWGEEFEKEKSKMEEHGGQLFTYLNQDRNAKFLVLYTSKFENDTIEYENLIVQIKDREEDLKKKPEQLKQENIKLYEWANNKTELFEVWKESFNKYFHFNGIFDVDANAYSLDLKALKKKNLKNLEDAKGLFNKFAEILRHNNISDNANAFNRVLSLFLCKIVDEEKSDEDILHFQVKEDEEYEHIIDRLQALYQKGMERLDEEIIYFADEVIKDIIKMYPKQTPLEKLQDIFTQLKYYTNNEFAFKEVHNKKLFVQNARVLVEVIKLLQNYKFRFTNKQQVLGDFFELMLNHGVKQSEGQFFTPLPIVRFIILSLGFENIIKSKIANNEDDILPKILDYACGAGHFLTESIEEIQQILKTSDVYNDLTMLAEQATKKHEIELYNIYKDTLSEKYKNQLIEKFKKEFKEKYFNKIEAYKKDTAWAVDYIFGIEKDYRLARTSQIACYINGDGEANIIFGDGLEEHDRLKLDKKKFDVVVANPPYSVEAFRNYLNVGRTHFDLFNALTERSKEIEVLFIERTKQVLANGGLAGIILPSSILSNAGLYSKAREILLKHFEIKAITELGSKTFIATGTTTVILFLKRRNDDFLKDRNYIASDYFNHTQYQINYRYIDAEKFLKMFVEHRGFELDDYKQFLETEINESLANTEMFKEYRNVFDNSTEVRQLQTKTYFKNYSKEEKENEFNTRFYEYCKELEKEKFLYFMLCLGDGNKNIETMDKYYTYQKTIIVKTGKEIEEQKEYLGYEFVGRKGQEGIKIYNYGGKMFDETKYDNPEKANCYIRKTIQNIEIETISPELEKYVSVFNLVDLIDVNRVEFEKVIKTVAENKIDWNLIWKNTNLKLLNEIAEIKKGTSITEEQTKEGEIPVIAGGQQPAYYHNVSNRESNIITVSASGAYAGFVNYWVTKIFASDCSTISSKNEKMISTKLIFEFLKIIQTYIYKLQKGQAQPHVYPDDLAKIKIPVPPKEIQEKIVKEIEVIEKKEAESNTKIEELEKDINDFILNAKNELSGKFIDFATLEYGSGLPEKNRILGEYPVMGSNGNVGYHNEFLINGPAIIIGRKGSAGKIVYQEKNCFPIDTTFYINLLNKEMPLKYFYYYIKTLNFEELAKGVGVPGLNRNNVYELKIQLPSIEEQKKLISSIEKKEKEIENLKVSLSTVNSEKEEVLRKYL